MSRCQGTTKKGKPCNGGAIPGTRLCGPHQGQDINETILKGEKQ